MIMTRFTECWNSLNRSRRRDLTRLLREPHASYLNVSYALFTRLESFLYRRSLVMFAIVLLVAATSIGVESAAPRPPEGYVALLSTVPEQ
jgi:hypothetical protein